MSFFIDMLFGHLFGDYIFQNKWLALSKGASGFRCFIHCLVYTACVCVFMWDFRVEWVVIVFVSHFWIDRLSMADVWLDLINGRSLNDFIINGQKEIPFNIKTQVDSRENYHVLRGGFTALVYCVVDNTMHLAIMNYSYRLLIT